MRWREIKEDFKQALPVRAKFTGSIKKAKPLIPSAGTDPLGAITQQVAAMLQASTSEDLSDEDIKKQEMLEKLSDNSEKQKSSMLDKNAAREEIKRSYTQRK